MIMTTKKKKETQAQKIDRMAKLRARKKPAEYKNVHPYVLSLIDEDPYSLVNVKNWIKHNKEMIAMLTAQSRNKEISVKDKQRALTTAENKKAYIRYIEHYIRTGDWIGMFSGQDETKKVIPRCVAMAYEPDGTPKRTVGIFYPDINAVWTNEMENRPVNVQPKKRMALTDRQFDASL
jgi:hypothetical protein